MTVLITLTTAGANTGPFNLYSDIDGYTAPFASAIAKSTLLAGYTSTVVPDGTTTIKVLSAGDCIIPLYIEMYTGCRPQGLITLEYFNSYTDGGTVVYTASLLDACNACAYINANNPAENALFGQSDSLALGETVYAGTDTDCNLLADGFYITDHATCQITEIASGIIASITYCV